GGQVDHRGHPGQVLEDHPGRAELDLGGRLGRRVPSRERPDVVGRDVHAVLGPEQVLEQDLETERKVSGRERVQPVYLVAAVAHRQRGATAEAVPGHCMASCPLELPCLSPRMRPAVTASSRSRRFPASPALAGIPAATVGLGGRVVESPLAARGISTSSYFYRMIYLDVKLSSARGDTASQGENG